MPARPFASFPASQNFKQNIFFFAVHALFMGPDPERPKSYQSFSAMGNVWRPLREKTSDLHTSNFSFIISFLSSSPIAQSVERRTVNPQVAGSSPARGAKEFRATHASEWPFWFSVSSCGDDGQRRGGQRRERGAGRRDLPKCCAARAPGCCAGLLFVLRCGCAHACAHPVCVSFPAVWMHSISCATGSAMTPAAAAEFATIWDPFPIWGAAQ